MTSYLRKQIAMGVYSRSNQRQNFGFFFPDWFNADASPNSPYVRFWIDWTQLAPYGPNNPATDNVTPLPQGGTPQSYLMEMDAQIRLAKLLGLKVILTFHYTPSWASGVPTSTQNFALAPPADRSPGGPWSAYFAFVFLRWSPYNPNNGGAWCDFLEVCNEPNLDPSIGGPPGLPWDPDIVAQLMLNAFGWQIALAGADNRYLSVPVPVLGAPALDDGPGSDTYTSQLLTRLSARSFPLMTNPYWVWTHHNYRDMKGVTDSSGDVTVTSTRAQRIRSALKNRWSGWPYQDTSNPYVLLTEGGAKASDVGLSGQATRLTMNHALLHNDSLTLLPNGNLSGGQGLAMLTQYLDVTASTLTTPNPFDTGLRTDNAPLYTQRPAYNAWRALPPT